MIDPQIYCQDDKFSKLSNDYTVWLAALQDVPNGQYLVPNHYPRALLINNGDLLVLGNICTHKHATMLDGRGKLGNVITCPIHKWSWTHDGHLRGARGFKSCKSMDLDTIPVHQWKNHVFSGDATWLDSIGELGDLSSTLDSSHYEWHSHSSITYQFNWKIFMEIFLDLYHVKGFHPGLSSLTDCRTFDWKFGDGWCCQTGLFNHGIIRDQTYLEMYDLYRKTGHYDQAQYGAIWLGIYPNIMIEHYPGCLVVSTVWPNGPTSCTNHLDFYYEKELLEHHPVFADVQQRCFMATADEDETIGKKMQLGMEWTNKPFVPMNHPIEEAGHAHFHEWLLAKGIL
jgi:choline monooxygenase